MWEILGIEPTTDIREIKSAYARLAKKYNPEEQPEEFQRLHAAYKQATALAKRVNSPGKNHKTGDGVDFSALSRTEKKSEKPQTKFDFSEVDDSRRIHEKSLPQEKSEFVFPHSEQKREEASDKAADYFDFSSINTDKMEMSDEERQEKLRKVLLGKILRLLSDKKRINNYNEWYGLLCSENFDAIVGDSEFRVGAARLFASRILTKEVANLAAYRFGDGSVIVRINSLTNEWAVSIGLGHKHETKQKKTLPYRSSHDLPPVVGHIVVVFAVILFIVMPMAIFLDDTPSVTSDPQNSSYGQPQGAVTLREYEEGEDPGKYLTDAFFEAVNETSFSAEDLYKLCMGEWEISRGKITFYEDYRITIERDGECYSGTVEVTPAEKGAELSLTFYTEDRFYNNATATAKLFHPKGKGMIITTADGKIHPTKYLPAQNQPSEQQQSFGFLYK